jgi:hypothetical protein
MASIIFRLAVGCVFILFGRWAYRNPNRLYPNTFYTNPESPLLVRLTRAFALLLILVGSFAILTVATERLTKSMVEAFIALGLSVASTWFLRPRIPEAQPVSKQAGGFLTTRGKWFVGISLTLAALTIVLVIFVFLHR